MLLQTSSLHRNVHKDTRKGIFGPGHSTFDNPEPSVDVAHVDQSVAYSEAVTEAGLSLYYSDAPVSYANVTCLHASARVARFLWPTGSARSPEYNQFITLTHEHQNTMWRVTSSTDGHIEVIQQGGLQPLTLDVNSVYPVYVRNHPPHTSLRLVPEIVDIEPSSVSMDSEPLLTDIVHALFSQQGDLQLPATNHLLRVFMHLPVVLTCIVLRFADLTTDVNVLLSIDNETIGSQTAFSALEEELNGTLTRTTSSTAGSPYTDGKLDATVGWATKKSSFSPGTEWIDLTLPSAAQVLGVVVQRGKPLHDEWYVSAFKVQALIGDVWVDINQDGETDSVWAGPDAQSSVDDRIEARFPSQKFVTTKIRVIPWTWIGWPVLRVGLIVATDSSVGPRTCTFGTSTQPIRQSPVQMFDLHFSGGPSVLSALFPVGPSVQAHNTHLLLPAASGLLLGPLFTSARPRRCLLYLGSEAPQELVETQKSVFAVEEFHQHRTFSELILSKPIPVLPPVLTLECWTEVNIYRYSLLKLPRNSNRSVTLTIGLSYVFLPVAMATGLVYAVVHVFFPTGRTTDQHAYSTRGGTNSDGMRFVCAIAGDHSASPHMRKLLPLTPTCDLHNASLPLQIPDVMIVNQDDTVLTSASSQLSESLPSALDCIFVGLEVQPPSHL